ncbi:MAG: transcriptional repressor [Sphaerochaeta sp.]|jgi:Fe2+ or Zn2+ uptake regulation protein|nr:transcriptional repressor [Sphaerochaeta sp.]PKL27011.1 MAG: hypothetical protein CVV46_13735 [Spirochaetae bacterium HGW-Spirochaetae-2]
MKYSRQRELILETLRRSEVHPTAEEVYVAVKKHMPSISLGTVYRNLGLLVELGNVRKLETAGTTRVRYDGRNDEHCHLICSSCGNITDVDLGMFAAIDTRLHTEMGFTVSEHGIVLKGICAECSVKAIR